MLCGSKCPPEQKLCPSVRTITFGTQTTTTTTSGCCSRLCTKTSAFFCPPEPSAPDSTGGCCSYGSICGADRKCLPTSTPSSSRSAVVTRAPPGCTQGQISCAASLGGGCCGDDKSCVLSDDTAYCAPATITPTASGLTPDDDRDSGSGKLSPGATAGVAVGVVSACGILVGAAWWLCVRGRRKRRSRRRGGASDGGEGVSAGTGSAAHVRPRPAGVIGAIVGSAGAAGRDRAFSDATASDVPMSRSGMAHDYFGPDAALGPYSDLSPYPDEGGNGVIAAPGGPNATTTTSGPPERRTGGVPLQPHGPGDIAVPVEIDSRVVRDGQAAAEVEATGLGIWGGNGRSRGGSAGSAAAAAASASPPGEGAVHRFELYGSSPPPPAEVDGTERGVGSGGANTPSPYVPSPDTGGAGGAGMTPSPSPGERPR